MIFYIVFENDSKNLIFKALYENLDNAVEHALALHRHVNAEVHKVWLKDHFSERFLTDIPSHKMWSSELQSGAV